MRPVGDQDVLDSVKTARKTAWIIALSLPLWFVPLWISVCKLAGTPFSGLATATIGLLLVMLAVAATTDSNSRLIPNWITYSGILWGLGINGYQTWFGNESTRQMLGAIGLLDSLAGFAGLFFGLLVIFSFSGGGAGDVKLAGAIGSFLGLQVGFEAILISFVCCAVIVLGRIIIERTFPRLLLHANWPNEETSMLDENGHEMSIRGNSPEQNPLQLSIPLAPFFAIGTFVCLLRLAGIIEFEIIRG